MAKGDFQRRLDGVGLSQREFAESLGVAYSTVNRWATGKLKAPRYALWVLQLIAERYEVGRRLTEGPHYKPER